MASGGIVTYSNGWKIHKFNTGNDGVGVFNVDFHILGAKVLVVGGGGGGSSAGGSGGWAEEFTDIEIPAGSYDMTVGEAGNGQAANSTDGQDGGDTKAFDGDALEKVAAGGEGGAHWGSHGQNGKLGSGGGADSGGTTNGGDGTEYDGKGNGGWTGSPCPAGGGAGAGQDGEPGNNADQGGDGGDGVASDITGSSSTIIPNDPSDFFNNENMKDKIKARILPALQKGPIGTR